MEPRFRRSADGSLNLTDTLEAANVKSVNKAKPWVKPLSPELVLEKATRNVIQNHGNPGNRKHLLGFFEIQFGVFHGQTFKWVAENALGYAAYLVAAMRRDPTGGSKDNRDHAHNKLCFREYMELFPSGQTAIAMMEEQYVEKNPQPAATTHAAPSTQLTPPIQHAAAAAATELAPPVQPTAIQPGPSSQHPTSTSSLRSPLVRKNLPNPQTLTQGVKKIISPSKDKHKHAQPSPKLVQRSVSSQAAAGSSTSLAPFAEAAGSSSSLTPFAEAAGSSSSLTPFAEAAGSASSLASLPQSSEIDNIMMLAEAIKWEEASVAPKRVCLPAGWIHTLPEVDQRWISKALFKWSAQGSPELDFSRVDRLWWYPPQVPLKTSCSPQLENYFGHPLLLWMPRKLWKVNLACPHPDCTKQLLTSAGLHQKIRQVVGVGSMFYVASEYLACKSCKRKVISWSHALVSQLDIGHRVQFPCILTSKLACDMEVASLMRQRGLGNISSQIQRKLQERHAEVWLQKTIQYLTDCKALAGAAKSGLILPVSFEGAPAMLPVPKHRWLMQVYAQDVLQRLEEIKAAITSQYGRILKMDSTKKVARKLAGGSYGTSTWATNVGNEYGQVIMSVLTASEGFGLGPMIEGLIKRYRVAGVAPPEALYVDRDCCGNTLLRRMFEEWNQMTIRLDVWHYMRRIAVGCTTDSHQLYASFMGHLSHCIFMWDKEDLEALKQAKKAELEADRRHPSEADVMRSISRSELALHCKRTTRGTKETQALIESHIRAYDGDAGRDTLGVPLINSARMQEIWKSQKEHVACIQDPPGIKLYTQTGTLVKGGHRLPTYRSARGSTSLESFHLHLNRFIPGTLASDTFFQAYLVDGLARWNEDRAVAATANKQQPHSYSHLLRHAANSLAEEVLGEKILPYVGPSKYTGELIGVEYLYHQTGKVLQDYKLAIEESETTDVVLENEGCAEAEEFQDITVPLFETEQTPASSSQASAVSVPTPATPSLSPIPPSPLPSPGSSSASTQLMPDASPVDQMTEEAIPPPDESSSHDDAVGPDNIEGYGAVQDLADYLVGLKDHSLTLNGDECGQIIALWQALGEYDKKKTVYQPHHKATLEKGRFRATKKIVAPGVESTKRTFIGAHSPAQWPDCNRVVEAIFTRLCALYQGDVRCGGVKVSRFTMVTRAYQHIRECVVNNARLMTETTIQLPEVNAATVTQWYSRRCRAQEQSILRQGVSAPDAPIAGPEKLLDAMQTSAALHPSTSAPPHIFVMPPNTAGEARLKIKVQPQVIPQGAGLTPPVITPAPPVFLSFVSQPVPILPRPSQTATPVPGTSQMMLIPSIISQSVPPQTTSEAVPYTTRRQRKRREERRLAGQAPRKYIKKTNFVLCKKCKKDRKPPSHHQYFGNWYCEESESQSYMEWRTELEKRGYGKKRRRK